MGAVGCWTLLWEYLLSFEFEMGINNVIILSLVYTGLVFGNPQQLSSDAYPDSSVHQPLDNAGYYAQYPSASGYDYDAGYLGQVGQAQEEDRQDILSTSLGGGITIAMAGTAFIAALIGAMVAPVLNEGMTRLMDFEIPEPPELPEITLPELPKEAEEKARSLEDTHPWVGIVENMYSALRAEVNMRKSQKVNKLLNKNKL